MQLIVSIHEVLLGIIDQVLFSWLAGCAAMVSALAVMLFLCTLFRQGHLRAQLFPVPAVILIAVAFSWPLVLAMAVLSVVIVVVCLVFLLVLHLLTPSTAPDQNQS